MLVVALFFKSDAKVALFIVPAKFFGEFFAPGVRKIFLRAPGSGPARRAFQS